MKAVMMAACAATVCAAAPGPMWHASRSDFEAWMRADGFAYKDGMPMSDLKLGFVRRVASWASEQLKNQASIYNVYSWLARASGLDVGTLAEDLEKLSKADSTAAFVAQARDASAKHDKVLRRERKSGEQLGEDEYKYWGFIPTKKANVLPNGKAVTWSGDDCKTNTATATYNADKTEVELKIKGTECELLRAGDFYLLATLEGLHFVKIGDLSREHTINWKVKDATDRALQYDSLQKGIRVMRFPHDEARTLADVLATAELFLQPEVGKYPVYPSKAAMEKNVDFITKYTLITPTMTERADPKPIALDESLVQTGDFFGIIRLDGLDPMLAWAMGSTTGHTTIAMRDTDNQLHVCESTAKGDYWPVNGIQCTPWAQWIDQAYKAGFSVVWAPLAPEQRAKLDPSKMWAFFEETKGLDYGYHTLLWGWVDTETNNYPCAAPDFKQCLTWDVVELLFGLGHTLAPELVDMLSVQAWNFRIGQRGLSPAEIYYYAETKMNMSSSLLPTIPEQDSWRYNMTRDGKPAVGRSMVCCVFVCNMWKAGGLFGDTEVNCGELTNFDDYSLNIFNPALTGNNRPDVCKQADPSNELCQLMGPYTLNLNHFNQSSIYSHMDEKCPSWTPGVGPNYWGVGKQTGTC